MKSRLLCAFVLTLALVLHAADFSVTTPGSQFAFNINGVNTPTLTLVRGRTYTFAVSTSGSHPFRINATGVVNNSISSGTITFNVPTNVANYTYDCVVHGISMRGTIQTTAPPVPPIPRIVSFQSTTTNIFLRSTPSLATFSLFPEFSTNLNNSNWFALTVLSNRVVSGTNETWCGRPPGTNIFVRLRVQ